MKNSKSKAIIFILCLAIVLVAGLALLLNNGKEMVTPSEPVSPEVPTPLVPAPVIEVQVPTVTVTLYYPYDTGTDFAIKAVDVETELNIGESKVYKVTQLLKTSPEGENLTPVVGPDVEVLGVEELADQIIKINVNREFITQMNAGTSLEGAIIQSFIKTIADIYDAKGVILLVEGAPYESGHYSFMEDEVIYVQ